MRFCSSWFLGRGVRTEAYCCALALCKHQDYNHFRHVLDTLISLAKSFPVHFLPEKVRGGLASSGAKGSGGCRGAKAGTATTSAASTAPTAASTTAAAAMTPSSSPIATEPGREGDFWSVLVRLDCNMAAGKRTLKAVQDEEAGATSFGASPLAQLISLLAHPVVKRSSLLTDRLLRLLALVSMAIPENKPPPVLPPTSAPPPLDLDGALLGRATEVPSCSRQESVPAAAAPTGGC